MRRVTLSQFLVSRQREKALINPDLRLLIETIARACKAISTRVNKGALADGLGSAGKSNVHGEAQKTLDIMSNDWWGEPLGAMLGRVLVLELSQRLPGSSVYSESGAISADPNASVGVNVQRLDADKAGTLILIAQVAIDFNRPKREAGRNFTISKPRATPDIPGLVAAISDAVGELADGIAALLQS